MPNLLVSYTITQRLAPPFGQRVWDNGLAETYQTSRRFKDVDGVHRTMPVTPAWYRVASLGEAQLEALRAAIAAVNPAEIPEEIATVVPGLRDISAAEWQVDTPAGLKQIRVAQWGPLDPAAEPLMGLVDRMGAIVAVAAAGLEIVPD